jgi:hypothetical protein
MSTYKGAANIVGDVPGFQLGKGGSTPSRRFDVKINTSSIRRLLEVFVHFW